MTVSVGDDIVELPASLIRVLLVAVEVLEYGDTVVLVNEEVEVSPAEAAKLLGVSHQYVDRQVAADVSSAADCRGARTDGSRVRAVLAHRTKPDLKRSAVGSDHGHGCRRRTRVITSRGAAAHAARHDPFYWARTGALVRDES